MSVCFFKSFSRLLFNRFFQHNSVLRLSPSPSNKTRNKRRRRKGCIFCHKNRRLDWIHEWNRKLVFNFPGPEGWGDFWDCSKHSLVMGFKPSVLLSYPPISKLPNEYCKKKKQKQTKNPICNNTWVSLNKIERVQNINWK